MRYNICNRRNALLLSIYIAAASIAGCTTNTQEAANEKIVILENQEKEINKDTLKLEKIKDIKWFYAKSWIDDDRLVGKKLEENGVKNLSIYNVEDGSMVKITDNKSSAKKPSYSVIASNVGADGHTQVIYTSTLKIGEKATTYVYDLNDKTTRTIGENFFCEFQHNRDRMDDDRCIFSDGKNIILYDFKSKLSKKIDLPTELKQKILEFNYTFEQWLEAMPRSKESKKYLADNEIGKRLYNARKENNRIFILILKDDDLYIKSSNYLGYVFNLKTNEYRREDFDYDPFMRSNKYRRAIEGYDEENNIKDLREVDRQGNLVTVIDSYDISGWHENSPDNGKVAYYNTIDKKLKLNIYEFDSKKSFTIDVDEAESGSIEWNPSSTRFVTTFITIDNNKYSKFDTEIYTLY